MPALTNPKHERFAGLPLITREQAKASSSTKFFVAEQCKRGHVAEQYVANDKCVDICSNPNQIKKPIYWDHCHSTGKFRGWLCHRCNTILGKVDDSPEMLRKMANYLEQTSPK